MSTEYKLSYTAAQIDEKLGKIDNMVKSVNNIEPDENGNVEIVVNNERVDLSGYATEQWVQNAYQPKGEYLTEVPSGYATEDWVQTNYQPKGEYLTEHQDISGKLDADKLPEAINTALAQAKASGEFDGKDGKTTDVQINLVQDSHVDASGHNITRKGIEISVITEKEDGSLESKGGTVWDGVNGNDYVLTDADKTEIAEIANNFRVNIPKNNNVRTVSHRGFCSVAPENTIPAYILSKKNGYEYVECDVSFTSDGVAVLLHDATIDRTSNGIGNISNMTYEQASQYDYGYWKNPEYRGTHLPTFKEFLLLCKGLGLHPYIEIKKDDSYTKDNIFSIVNEVKVTGMSGKVSYISFNKTYLEYIKAADAKARLGYVMSTITSTKITQATDLKTDTNEVFIDAKYTNLTDSTIQLCIDKNLPLEVWTVDDEAWFDNMPPYISGVTSNILNACNELYNRYITYSPREMGHPTATNISLSETELDINSFDTQTIVATLEPANALDEVVWASSNEDVVKVNNGILTPNSSGTAIITATASHYSASCIVNVVVNDLVTPDGYEMVQLFKATDIMYGVGSSWLPAAINSTPIYVKERDDRAGRYLNDIPVESGYAYRIDFIATDNTTPVGMQIANTKLVEYINNPSVDNTKDMLRAGLFDPGWLNNGDEVEIPEEYNGYACASMRFTFKPIEGVTSFTGNEIRQVLISKRAVTA